jgi:transglutaminase-like putative cysteine protease
MKIRAGYEITYDCPQPTPMIVELSVHPIRRSDLITPDAIRLEPPIPIKEYRDGFENICQVIKAPKGEITMFSDFLIEDSGKPDEIAPDIVDHALEKLPVETLVYLLGSRYCETDRLSEFAWFGTFPKGGALVQAICDLVHQEVTFGYEHASVARTAFDTFKERRGVPDRSRVSADQDYEVRQLAEKHGLSPTQIRELIARVGNDRAKLEEEAQKLRRS